MVSVLMRGVRFTPAWQVAEQITEVCSVPWRACRQSDVFGKQQPIAPKRTTSPSKSVSY